MDQKIKRVLDQIGLGYLWIKAHENDIGGLEHYQTKTERHRITKMVK